MTTPTTNVKNVLESLILVSLSEIHGISGRKKLKREDFGEGVELPPDVIVSLGSKKVIDPKLLNPFTQYKTKAHTLCSAVGIRFLGGYAVPADRVNDLISTLNDVKSEFYIYKKTFLQSDFDSWIDKCEEKYRKILRDGASVDLDYMDNQIQFGFTAIHITPYGNSIIQDGIAGQVKSLTDEVFDEVSGLVDGFLKNLNQTAFTQHTINPLRRTADKLSSLGFISDSVNKLAIYMSEMLNDVPQSGKVTGRKYSDILSLLNNLRDPQHAKSFVDLLNVDSISAQPDDGNQFVDLSGLPGNVSATSGIVVPPSVPAVATSLSPALVAADSFTVDTGSFIPEGLDSENHSMDSTIEVDQVPKTALTSTAEILSSEHAAHADDGFATDLPSGNEVIVEPVADASPAAPAVDKSASAAPAVVEGFRNVVVVDDLDNSADKTGGFSSIFDGNEDGILIF